MILSKERFVNVEVFKILDNSLKSPYVSPPLVIQYKVGEWVSTKDGISKIFCFLDLQSAKNYIYKAQDTCRLFIYKAEGLDIEEIKSVLNPMYLYRDDQFKDFWKKRVRSIDRIGLMRVPDNTVFCSSLRIFEKC